MLVAVTQIACKAGTKLEHSLTKCGVAGCTWVATGVLLSGRLCLEQVQAASCYVKVGFLELGGVDEHFALHCELCRSLCHERGLCL